MTDPAARIESLLFDDYLELEQKKEIRHELVKGEMQAMGGGTDIHNLISSGLCFALKTRLRETGCRVFIGDVKIRTGENGRYPDVFVTCARDDKHPLYKTKPILIAEVLSDSTQSEDRGEKFADYRKLDSLEDYLLIAQSAIHIEHFQRKDHWNRDILLENDSLNVTGLNLQIPVKEIYQDVFDQLGGKISKMI